MCFGRSKKRSTNTVPFPKADFASEVARSKESFRDACSRTTLMPRPPPPKAALIIMGKPYSSVNAFTSSNFSTGPSVPGTTGTLHFIAKVRAETLSPRELIVSAVGPTNMRPAASTARAKSAFSERKPYPGWIIFTPCCLAIFMISSPARYAATGVYCPLLPIIYASSASYHKVSLQGSHGAESYVRGQLTLPVHAEAILIAGARQYQA